MTDNARARRIADRIHEVVATLLDTRIKDPRLGFVTVTDVRVTGDLQHATVFYTVLGADADREDSAAALASASGLIRSEVGKALGIRLTPSLEFVPDALPETAAHLEDALRAAKERDAELARSREGAVYAGDADPYRVPQSEDPDGDRGADVESASASTIRSEDPAPRYRVPGVAGLGAVPLAETVAAVGQPESWEPPQDDRQHAGDDGSGGSD